MRIDQKAEAEYLQCTHAEHHSNTHFLLPVQIELQHLRHREANHPDIERDTCCCICPAQSVQINASSMVFSVPLIPIVIDWPALEYADKDKDDVVYNVEANGTPDQLPKGGTWEDPKVEEEERQLQQCNMRKVEYLHSIKYVEKARELFESNGPDVPA